jgi:hypothetical protein
MADATDALLAKYGATPVSGNPAPAPPAGDATDALLAKYGATPATVQQNKPLSWLDQAGQYAKGVWDNLQQTGQGMVDIATTNPLTTLKTIGQNQDALRLKAQDAFKRGDLAEGARHVVDYLLPVIGPGIDALGDEAGSGKPGALAHSLGGATSLGLQLTAPGVLNANAGTVGAAMDTTGTAIRGAAKGAVQGGTEMGTRYGIPLPAALVGGGAGKYALGAFGVPPEIGATVGAAIPIVRGAIRGARTALAARAATAADATAATTDATAAAAAAPAAVRTGPIDIGYSAPAGTPSAADQLAAEAQPATPAPAPTVEAATPAAPAAAEDTALLDGIAQGMGKTKFAKLSADQQSLVRSLADRIKAGESTQQPVASTQSPAPSPPPAPAAAPPVTRAMPSAPAAIPETRAPGGGAPLRPPFGPRPTEENPTPAAQPSPAPPAPASAPAASQAPAVPTPKEMAAAFNPDKAAFEKAQAARQAAADAKHIGARNAWADEMASRLFQDGKGITPQDAQLLSPLNPDGTYTVSPELDQLARAKNGSGKGPLPPASKMSPDTILRMHMKLWDLWNDSLPPSAPPVGHSAFHPNALH